MAGRSVLYFGEDSIVLHLVGEVAAVEFYLEDGFVQVLELGQGENLGEEFKSHGLEMDVLLETGECHAEDFVVVEGQVRDVGPAEPFGFFRIGARFDLGEFDKGVVRDGDHAFARVAPYITEGADFLEILDRKFEPGFLLQFPEGRVGNGFVFLNVQESAGQRPFAGISCSARFALFAALDQEHLELLAVVSEDHGVSRYGRVRVLISILTFLCHGVDCFGKGSVIPPL